MAIQLLVRSEPNGAIDVEELMKYPITPVPYSIGTGDGYLEKTDKTKGLQYILKDVEDVQLPQDETTLVVQDGNALFHTLQEIPGNFKQIAHRISGALPKKPDIIFSADMYTAHSVKGMEHERLGYGEKFRCQWADD